MAGRTGKLTNEALRNRGPRLVLAEGEHENGESMMVVFRENQSCFKSGFGHGSFAMVDDRGGYISFHELARSYSLNYLLNLGRTKPKLK